MRHIHQRLWESLSPLLDQALDLEPEARQAFLSSLGSIDPIVATTLGDLLGETERVLASDFLEVSPLTSTDLPDSLRGRSVGAYTLECPLGMGGMGTVWLAHRSDGRFEGHVAVKLVNLSVFDSVARERFAREGTLLARLAHPNIARLFDAGITAAGQPFLVLEYVNGKRIDAYADGQQLDVRRRLELFLQVADAVAHAHANLVVHRDLKPSNILVDDSGQVKLLDFGIAKLLRDEGADQGITVLTAPALTIRYAAPEQVAGGLVSTATDVYALAVLLYELLGGSHPTLRDESDPAAQVRVLAEREPLRLSEAVRLGGDRSSAATIAGARATSPDRLRRVCRGDLDVILAKALKKSPAERYGTVTAFADDLRRHLRNEPVTARRDSLPYRVRKFTVRHRLGFAAAATVAAALVAGTAIAVLQARESAHERDRALAETRRAEATNDFSTFLLSQARRAGKPISNAELLARGEALIAKRFAKDPELRVHMLLTLADRYQENQQHDAWNRVVRQAYDDSRSISDIGVRSYAACTWALSFAEGGDFARAFALLDEALPLVSTPSLAEFESGCRVGESIIGAQANQPDRAIHGAERAVALEEQRGGAPGRQYVPLSVLARAYVNANRYSDADRAFARAFAVLEAEGLDASRNATTLLSNWSAMLQETGQMLAGLDKSRRVVDIARSSDTDAGATAPLLEIYGNALMAVGDYAEATSVLDEALQKEQRTGSPTRYILALAYAIQAACESGDRDRGARLLKDAHATIDANPSLSSYYKAIVEASEARVAFVMGDIPRAVKLARHALATFETATPNKWRVEPTQILLSRFLNAAGLFGEALPAAERGVAMVRERLPGVAHSYQMGQALLELATAKSGLGDAPGARDVLAGALENLHPTAGATGSEGQRAAALRQALDAR